MTSVTGSDSVNRYPMAKGSGPAPKASGNKAKGDMDAIRNILERDFKGDKVGSIDDAITLAHDKAFQSRKPWHTARYLFDEVEFL